MASNRHLPVIDSGKIDDLLDGKSEVDDSLEEKLGYEKPIFEIPTTNKLHISYSEISTWLECAFRHRLKYIDNINLDGPSEHTEFGQVIHDALEQYLKTKVMPNYADIKTQFNELLLKVTLKNPLNEKEWHDTIEPILEQAKVFLEETFPGWEYVAAEYELLEDIEDQKRKFKGFIDGIIKVPKKPRKGSKGPAPEGFDYYLIDWKTTGWGWSLDKKIDPNKTLQLVLYKYFWSKKMNVDISEIKCGFVLLKRTAKVKCEFVSVSVGEKSMQKGIDTINTMLGYIKKGFFPKNRSSCTYCVYKGTKYCV